MKKSCEDVEQETVAVCLQQACFPCADYVLNKLSKLMYKYQMLLS